jgi:hypothetical protein
MTGPQSRGNTEALQSRGCDRDLSQPAHLAFSQSFLDHSACAASMAGRDILHMGTGVTDRVEAIR